MTLKAFVTTSASIHNGMNFLGIAPGPKKLLDYMFFHQFRNTFYPVDKYPDDKYKYKHIKNIKLDVQMRDGLDELQYNWQY